MKPLTVLYETADIIVINKPAGLPTQGGAGIRRSADTALTEQTGRKIYPVHRLDKDTAGALLAAKTAEAAREWAEKFAAREVGKEYAALCLGAFPRAEGALETPAGKKGREKPARTAYRAAGEAEGFSLLILTPRTGRTHQIRQQLAAAGHPVAGDGKYGGFAANREAARVWGIKRLQLAAVRLTLPFPGGAVTVRAPLPPHMEAALRALGIGAPREGGEGEAKN